MSNQKPFPKEFFPDELILALEEIAYCYKFNEDYLLASALSAFGTCIGNSYALRVKDSWIERACFWIAIVGLPGVAKSHPLSWSMDPITKYENDLYKDFKLKLAEWNNDPDKDKKPKPELIKTIIGDATPESVAHQLSINERGLLIYNDELATFLRSFERYNKGTAHEFHLTAWSCKPILVDRKSSFPIRINTPVINIIGTTQPSVLKNLFKDKEDSGFVDRWLIVNPKDVKKEYWTDDVVSSSSLSTYKNIINNLLSLNMTVDDWDNNTSHIIDYDGSAKSVINEWHKHNTDKINETDSEVIRSVRSKMEVYIHRFALIAYLIENAIANNQDFPSRVDERSASKACKLADYFLDQILSFRNSDITKELKSPWKEIYDMLPIDEQEFKIGDFYKLAESFGVLEDSAKSFFYRNVGKLFKQSKRSYYYKI